MKCQRLHYQDYASAASPTGWTMVNDSAGGVCITVTVLGVSRYPKNNNTSLSPAGPWVLIKSRGKFWVQAGNGDVSDCNGERR